MAPIPQRPAVSSPYRRVLAYGERHLPLPNVNPALYQLLGILLSVGYLYLDRPLSKAAIIGIVLLADWLDGATARRHKRIMRSGYIADVMIDRASEGLIFAAEAGTWYGNLFFVFWLVNTSLAYYSIRTGRHSALPLRGAYIGVLLILAGRALFTTLSSLDKADRAYMERLGPASSSQAILAALRAARSDRAAAVK